jgi:hypothetical protein
MISNLQHDTGSARQRGPRRDHSHRPHRFPTFAANCPSRRPDQRPQTAASLTCPRPIYAAICRRHPAVRFDGAWHPVIEDGKPWSAGTNDPMSNSFFARSDALGKPSAVRAFMPMGE